MTIARGQILHFQGQESFERLAFCSRARSLSLLTLDELEADYVMYDVMLL